MAVPPTNLSFRPQYVLFMSLPSYLILQIGAKNTDASTYIVKVKDIYGSGNSKKKKSGPARPKVIVNDFTNNACESDVEDFYGNLTPGRPKVCLDAFERRSFSSESDGEYCSHPKT